MNEAAELINKAKIRKGFKYGNAVSGGFSIIIITCRRIVTSARFTFKTQ